jgi:hypothetical protein
MKKFLLKGSIFLLLLSCLSCIIIFIFEKKLGKITNSYGLKRQQLESKADSIEVFVLGSSQSLYGVNPACFGLRGYNVSNTSQSLFYDVNITRKYIDKMPKLKYVFIAISYFSLGYEVFDCEDKWRDFFYKQYWGITFPEIKPNYINTHSKIYLYTPEMSLAYSLKLFHVNLAKDYTATGWAKMTSPGIIDDMNGRKRVTAHDSNFKSKRIEGNKKILDTLLRELKKRNITAVFFTPPVDTCYYKFTDKRKVDIMYKTISEFCEKYGCKYYNYFTDNRFSTPDFADCDHLNTSGSEKFSKILNEEILKKDIPLNKPK